MLKSSFPILLLLCCFLTSCSSFFFYPDKVRYADPKINFELNYTERYFKSKDGLTLHMWILHRKPKTKDAGTVLFFHGNAQNLSSHFLQLAWLVKYGLEVIIFDYRGYGESEGTPSLEGVNKDSLAALEYAIDHHNKNSKGRFIVYGQSLGGAIAPTALGHFDKLSEIDLVVLDSTFPSYPEIAFDKMTDIWFLIPFSPLGLMVTDDWDPQDHYKKLSKTPVVVIHAKKDYTVPYKFGEKIYQKLETNKCLLEIPIGGHTQGFFVEKNKYREHFIDILNSTPELNSKYCTEKEIKWKSS